MALSAVAFTVVTAVSVAQQWAWGWTLALVIGAGLASPPLNAALRTSWRAAVNGEEGPLKRVPPELLRILRRTRHKHILPQAKAKDQSVRPTGGTPGQVAAFDMPRQQLRV